MKRLILTSLTVVAIALASPVFAAGKADKTNKPHRLQNNAPTTQRGDKLFAKIEEKLGHELTADQKQQIQQTTRETMKDMRPIQQSFVQNIANAVKVSPDQVKEAIKAKAPRVKGQGKQNADPESRICSALETKLDRKLNDEEIKAIEGAIETRKTDAKPVVQDYIESLAKITGLTSDQVTEIVPKQMGA